MDWKYIDTDGISCITLLAGTSDWYWGMNYTSGDLYEAEELYRDGHPMKPNRLIFIKYPEGKVYEPIKAEEGQYFGIPVYYQNTIYGLLVDFKVQTIIIYQCSEDMDKMQKVVTIALNEVKDCYNLMLAVSPLMLIRQGHENIFQMIWPDKLSFPIDKTESFMYRDGNSLIFSRWYEYVDYEEEIVVRDSSTGRMLERIKGMLVEMPDGQKWILKG